MFKKAEKKKLKARVAIAGPSGSGKTYSALKIARGLAQNGNIALIDTEYGSASLYADVTDFDVAELQAPFEPARYVKALAEAGAAGYDVVVIDSLSHAWMGEGGILDQLDKQAGNNKFGAWRNLTPQQNKLVEAILSFPGHVIVTLRSKHAYEITEENGKKKVEKMGLAPQQREGLEYEFTLFAEMDTNHVMHVTKTRCSDFADQNIRKPDEATGQKLLAWLDSGVEAPKPRSKTDELLLDLYACSRVDQAHAWCIANALLISRALASEKPEAKDFIDSLRAHTDKLNVAWDSIVSIVNDNRKVA